VTLAWREPKVIRSRLLLTASVAAVAAATFGLTWSAVSDRTAAPELGRQLPARGLPPATLAVKTQTHIADLLGSNAVTFGIDRRSLARVRILARTPAGPLYVVPGTKGQCVVLLPVLSCGAVRAGAPTVAVWIQDRRRLTGGGLLAAGHHSVYVVRADGSRLAARLVKGGFTFSEAARPSASGHIRVVVDPRPHPPSQKGAS
jgi:hypothetical protein